MSDSIYDEHLVLETHRELSRPLLVGDTVAALRRQVRLDQLDDAAERIDVLTQGLTEIRAILRQSRHCCEVPPPCPGDLIDKMAGAVESQLELLDVIRQTLLDVVLINARLSSCQEP